MNPVQMARLIMKEVVWFKKEMRAQGLSVPELAALSNIGVPTLVNLLSGRTYSPHYRTIMNIIDGLGYEMVGKVAKNEEVFVD